MAVKGHLINANWFRFRVLSLSLSAAAATRMATWTSRALPRYSRLRLDFAEDCGAYGWPGGDVNERRQTDHSALFLQCQRSNSRLQDRLAHAMPRPLSGRGFGCRPRLHRVTLVPIPDSIENFRAVALPQARGRARTPVGFLLGPPASSPERWPRTLPQL
jgi:hypothetical protein